VASFEITTIEIANHKQLEKNRCKVNYSILQYEYNNLPAKEYFKILSVITLLPIRFT